MLELKSYASYYLIILIVYLKEKTTVYVIRFSIVDQYPEGIILYYYTSIFRGYYTIINCICAWRNYSTTYMHHAKKEG